MLTRSTGRYTAPRFCYSNAFRQVASFLQYELIYPPAWSPREPLQFTMQCLIPSKNHTLSSRISILFFIPEHWFSMCKSTMLFVIRSGVLAVKQKNSQNSNWDLVRFHGRAQVTDKLRDPSPVHPNGDLECGKEMNWVSWGSCFFSFFLLVNCFELFLKENPSSHAVNICSAINGLTQVLDENVLMCLLLMCFLTLEINTPARNLQIFLYFALKIANSKTTPTKGPLWLVESSFLEVGDTIRPMIKEFCAPTSTN